MQKGEKYEFNESEKKYAPDSEKQYEKLEKRYNDLLAAINDIGFQIQLFAKQNRLENK